MFPHVKLSQTEKLLKLLKDRKWHTTVEIMQKVYRVKARDGICRVAARVYELRRKGYFIRSQQTDEPTVWSYRMN